MNPENPERDKAIERAGQALYGDLWIDAISKQDDKLGGPDDTVGPWPAHAQPRHGPDDLPKNFKQASAVAKARQRWRTFLRQRANVIHWLQHQHRIDMSPKGFDSIKFERFFKKHIPVRVTMQDRRKQAVATLLKTKRPGRSGNCTWAEFHTNVERIANGTFDLKTIQRDVQGLRKTK
jgi:hypothetical protein